MRTPTDKKIRALHEKYAPTRGAFELVYTHCEIVCVIAEQLIARGRLDLDVDLVRAGSLLHDIGVYRLYGASGELDHNRYLRHGILGSELLAAEGFPDVLCRFCSRHTGMGLSREDVRKQGLPIPAGDYLAETGEEEIVMYADKFHSKLEPPVFVTAASYATSVRRFGDDKVRKFQSMRERYGEPRLEPLMDRYGYALARSC
jgi:uncharacterized protein